MTNGVSGRDRTRRRAHKRSDHSHSSSITQTQTTTRTRKLTIEERTRDQATRAEHAVAVRDLGVTVTELAGGEHFAAQLGVATALDVAAVVLVEVLQLVVQVNRRRHLRVDGDGHLALFTRGLCVQLAVAVGAVAVILLDRFHHPVGRAPQTEPNCYEQHADGTECDRNITRRQDRLPRLEPLLVKVRVCARASSVGEQRGAGARPQRRRGVRWRFKRKRGDTMRCAAVRPLVPRVCSASTLSHCTGVGSAAGPPRTCEAGHAVCLGALLRAPTLPLHGSRDKPRAPERGSNHACPRWPHARRSPLLQPPHNARHSVRWKHRAHHRIPRSPAQPMRR